MRTGLFGKSCPLASKGVMEIPTAKKVAQMLDVGFVMCIDVRLWNSDALTSEIEADVAKSLYPQIP